MPFKRLTILPVLIALLLSACSPPVRPANEVTPAPATSYPAPTLPLEPTLLVEKAVPTQTQPGPAPAPLANDPACVAPQGQPQLGQASFAEMPDRILDYLNAGGTSESLDLALSGAGLGNQPRAAMGGDLTGDGKTDVVASIYNPASQNSPPAGALYIYICQNNSYDKAFQLDSLENFGAPGIRFLQDLNADGLADLVTSQAVCGATTCYESVQILSWMGTGFENRLTGSSEDLPYPDIQVKASGKDGIYDLVILGGSIGSAGAGPQRGKTRTWQYDTGSRIWSVASDLLDPSSYRVHVLQDADAALRRGDVDAALVDYQSVWSDSPPLEDFLDPKTEKQNLGAYAAYMIAAIHAKRGETGKAQATIEKMEQAYPGGTSQHAYVDMANAYLEALARGDEAAACDAVQAYASSHAEQVLVPLGQKTFGYANKDFLPQDMCP